jgi:AraC-like DNA-binding protein
VPEPKYKEVADEVEEMYWDHTAAEIQERLGIGGSTYSRAKEYAGLPRKTKANEVAHEHGVGLERLLSHLHYDAKMSVKRMADALGISRSAIYTGFKHTDVTPRGQSEAERVKNENMTKAERREQTEAARRRHFDRYGEDGHIASWVRENPEEHAEIAREAAPKGTPARDVNGMKGRTGQDHPSWRGGKHLVDALRKQLRPSWWRVRDEERADECYNCGASDCKLDVHHIVPLSAGGTNESWDLMTLCESCHRTAEAYVRQFEAFDAVITE